jgi:glutamate-1-semialdehyde aminotransferase
VSRVSAGFRLNTGGAHLIYGFQPDIAVFAKAVSNGYPMAAVIGRGDVMVAAQNTFCSSTYWTDRIGPAAVLATIRKHRRCEVWKHFGAHGQKVQDGWRKAGATVDLEIEVGRIPPFHFSVCHQQK